MKKSLIAGISAVCVVLIVVFLWNTQQNTNTLSEHEREEREEEDDVPSRYVDARRQYEIDMIKDPVTGKVPYGVQQMEKEFALTIPLKGADVASTVAGTSRLTTLNTYIPAGPNNIGGRTRAIEYDRRYNGTSNRVILAGSVSGGIMRSIDGGQNWERVSPENDIHNLTALAQDPASPDIWYAGGGEAWGNSTSELGATYLSFGIWKSVNNGATWTRLPLNTITDINGGTLGVGTLEGFDHPFDFVHRIAVHPTNGHVYIAGHRRLVRSTDGGNTFQVVLGGALGAIASAGQTEVVIDNNGRVYAAVNGGNPDLGLRGVWVSSTGNPNSFVKIAGGSTLGVDSVAGWRGNSYDLISAGTYSPKRILLALAPSNQNIAYAFYENGLSQESPQLAPETDFYKIDIAGNSFTWTNRSGNMPDFPGGNLSGSDPLATQGGYNMIIAVKPDNPNVVIIGGTNLYRSNDGFATPTSSGNTFWINGYATNFTYAYFPNGHPDEHSLDFNPSNPLEVITGDDGGIRRTSNIMDNVVSWSALPNYQTVQYYYVAIDPGEQRNNFAGGTQDNGTLFRDKLGILPTQPADSNNHTRLVGGDGAAVGISKLELAGQNQYLYGGSQYGNINRVKVTNGVQSNNIRPNGLTTAFVGATNEWGEFVTNFRVNPDNTEDLYYVNFNRLFRTTAASSVTAGGWVELTGISAEVNPGNPNGGRNIGIRAIAFSRGPYATSHAIYIGTTSGKILRLDDPRNAAPNTVPVDITPFNLGGALNIQDIAVNPNNDDEIMLVISNYGITSGSTLQNVTNIWWTNNAKSASPTWRQAEGNLAGTNTSGYISARSCVIATKKDAANNPVTEYYVGTAAGLYSVANLGTTLVGGGSPTWQREGGNVLNLAVIQSMAYRPGDNVLVVGTHGNGMYYTFLGTANFNPNQNTGVDPVTNDKNFIKNVYPTIPVDNIQYNTGNMIGIKKITVELYNMMGQQMMKKEANYQSGSIPVSGLQRGSYILSITSDNGRYRHIEKFIKK